jgi:hypothetical protein
VLVIVMLFPAPFVGRTSLGNDRDRAVRAAPRLAASQAAHSTARKDCSEPSVAATMASAFMTVLLA